MAQLEFGTKAETLERLRAVLQTAQVKPSFIASVAEWKGDPGSIIERIQQEVDGSQLVVRSAARCEDSANESHAGAFTSILNVAKDSTEELRKAIDDVCNSYPDGNPENQFFVQEQINDIKLSGVVFTRTADTLAPYYVVNYDDTSGSSETVTSGSTSKLKTYVRARCSPNSVANDNLRHLLSVVTEIEEFFDNPALDIEFAITNDNELYILQVRPIALRGRIVACEDEDLARYLYKVFVKIQKLNAPHPGLHGKKALYSVMTDWNPAEMIGTKPRMLALSLYKELVTDSVWAYQRNNYGYKNLRSFPLLISFLGCPYIDVRASFNSFVPKVLDEALSSKLVDYYIDSLVEAPTDHDKVEFNTIFSCYYLNVAERLKTLLDEGFTELEIDRIKFALLTLTNKIICPDDGLCQRDLDRVRYLDKRFVEITGSSLPTIEKIYWMIEDCKRYGTLPFAGLARAGFIAVQFLQSFIDLGIITEEERDGFMNSLNTVAKNLAMDAQDVRNDAMSKEDFLGRYGHLRPGTYDILSPRYDEAFDLYFETNAIANTFSEDESFSFSAEQKAAIQLALLENGIEASVDELLGFIVQAIEGREYGKFVFTRSLSKVLVLLEEWGARFKIGRDDMSYLNIRTVCDLYASLTHMDVPDILRADIERNREAHAIAEIVRLPQMITSEANVYDFFVGDAEPNFITLGRVSRPVAVITEIPDLDLSDKIVLIRSADPGYDWLFSRNIAGLVTMYGGANSHMAIRCAELQIPAVIGCGEKWFELWANSEVLDLDCANKQVRVVR